MTDHLTIYAYDIIVRINADYGHTMADWTPTQLSWADAFVHDAFIDKMEVALVAFRLVNEHDQH